MIRRLAIIGARGHYNLVLRELPKFTIRIDLVALSPGGDSVEPILNWCADQNRPPPPVVEDYRQILDDARPDVVVVCGPFENHARMCIDAIERGIQVLTEKPAALTLEDLDRLEAACAKHPNVHLAAMMQSRYEPAFYTAANLIRSGAIGDVRLIDTRKSYKLGRRPAYYRDRATYGGTIAWVGSHAIDWIVWFSGEDVRFESVFAAHSSMHSGENGTMERSAVCQFTFSGQRFATASLDVFRPENAPTHGDDWARVVGTDGVIEVRPGGVKLINRDNDGSRPIEIGCDRTLMSDFLDHIDGKRESLINAKDTLLITRACLLARQSADEKRVILFK
jgi:predicted dehydrogenase